jgi:hypothetical protein
VGEWLTKLDVQQEGDALVIKQMTAVRSSPFTIGKYITRVMARGLKRKLASVHIVMLLPDEPTKRTIHMSQP